MKHPDDLPGRNLMPLEEAIERAMTAMTDELTAAAEARAEAENLEETMKQKRAVLFVKYKASGESAATADQMARADDVYVEASSAWMAANLKHRRLDAAAEARRLAFEAWRTLNANKRAEMTLR